MQEQNQKGKYISDIIGEDYVKWGEGIPSVTAFVHSNEVAPGVWASVNDGNPIGQIDETDYGNTIFISAPTGSGKTHFILKTLLPYAISRNKTVLYLVNRRILKTQIEEDIKQVKRERGINNISDFIVVKTYQEIEQEIYRWLSYNSFLYPSYLNLKTKKGEDKICDYLVCDECHYFFHDSLFNPQTFTVFDYIWNMTLNAPNTAKIFISATMDKMYKYYYSMILNGDSWHKSPEEIREYIQKQKGHKIYTGNTFYSQYFNIHAFNSMEDIPRLIERRGRASKWLIFINDIKKGKELEKKIRKLGLDVVFIDSRYNRSEDTSGVVADINLKRKFDEHVLISTSVLDNGISIKDKNLTNLVVLAEDETEFIQMIGRKRIEKYESRKIDLYLCRRNANEFEHRLTYYKKIEDAIADWKNLFLEHTSFVYTDIYKWWHYILDKRRGNMARHFLYCYCTLQKVENGAAYVPSVDVSPFSEFELTERIVFYESQIKKFSNEGSSSFLKTQAKWLGIDEGEIDDVVVRTKEEESEGLREDMKNALNEILAGNDTSEFNMKENLSVLKTSTYIFAKKYLEIRYPNGIKADGREDKYHPLYTLYNSIRQIAKNKHYTDSKFNALMLIMGLEYNMKTNGSKEKIYLLRRGKVTDDQRKLLQKKDQKLYELINERT